jgi:hypothetical protein
MTNDKLVEIETCHAYDEQTGVMRFRASQPVQVEAAVEIMTVVLRGTPTPNYYNEFTPKLLRKLPKGSMVTLAREYSVCVYVKLPEGHIIENLSSLRERMLADEISIEDDRSIRIWWD